MTTDEADSAGQQMFGASMEEKISNLQRQQMENRLKKLEVEEARAQALINDN